MTDIEQALAEALEESGYVGNFQGTTVAQDILATEPMQAIARRAAIEREAVEHLTAEWRVQSKRADDEAALAGQLAKFLSAAAENDECYGDTDGECDAHSDHWPEPSPKCRWALERDRALAAYKEARR